jgi:RNA polymerase sigma factor (sigma-70 family)
MPGTQHQLADYVRTGSESAFREVVSNYLGLVYSAALRLTNGNTHFAEDIAQTVFADLARMAPKLSCSVTLGGWLHRHTCFVAMTFLRGERRRQAREREAVEMNALDDHSEENLASLTPLLDEAINQLGANDRAAILLRFFEQRDFRFVGEALGSNEDAARMRVSRALEKLQGLLRRQGVAFSTAALGTALASESLAAAPAGLAVSISSTAIAGTALTSGTTLALNFLKLMASTKLKATVAGLIIIGAVVTPLLLQQNAQARLREQDETLRHRARDLATLQADHKRLSLLAANASLSQEQSKDLQRLRTELGSLQQQTNEVAQLRQENRRLQAAVEKPRTPFQVKEEMIARADYSHNLMVAIYKFSAQNQGRFPATLEQAAEFIRQETNAPVITLAPEQYEIVFQGNPTSLKNDATNVIAIREREAWRTGPMTDPKGRWARYYGYADGSVRLQVQTNSDFGEFEKQHLAPAKP